METNPSMKRAMELADPKSPKKARQNAPVKEPKMVERLGFSTIVEKVESPLELERFTGKPPNRAEQWSKEELFQFIHKLKENHLIPRPFLMKIIQTGKTDYESPNSIYKM